MNHSLKNFQAYFPHVFDHVVDWRHRGILDDIVAKLDTGDVVIYNDLFQECRNLGPDPSHMDKYEFAREFGIRVRHMLRIRGITQQELARRCNLSQAQISNYIKGKCIPNICITETIAETLRCNVDDLKYIDVFEEEV